MTDPVSQPVPSSKARTFFARLFSTVLLWSVVLGALFAGHTGLALTCFLLIMMVLAGTGLAEFFHMARKRGLECYPAWGLIAGLLLVGSTFFYLSGVLGHKEAPAKAGDFDSSLLVLTVLGLCVRQFFAKNQPQGIQAIAVTLFGVIYAAWLLNFIQKIQFFPGVDGRWYVLYFILVTKFSDLGAYVTGSLVGRHKMIPRISPGKTWEGFAGALIWSAGVSVACAHFLGDRLVGMTVFHAVVLGLGLSLGAVVGDLIESLMKRESGVKDSGSFFPGIGGILDLLDSLLFNAPIMYLYLRHVLTH